jgi:ankyrin repeat protein
VPSSFLTVGPTEPLQDAVERRAPKLAAWLLAQGANVNAPDAYGRTPFHRAVALESLERTALLLAHGADATARDGQGHTPMD